MSYAVRSDGLGWRAVSDASECSVDEVWQNEQPSAPQPDPVQAVKNQITAIERDTMMNRASREGLLLLIEKEAMREFSVDWPTAQAGLYAGNLAYRKVKDVDNQIAALRAQIGAL